VQPCAAVRSCALEGPVNLERPVFWSSLLEVST